VLNSNILAMGSFEYDSDADGFPDGWYKDGATNTYSMESDPDNVDHEYGSLKVVLANSSNQGIRNVRRKKFRAGQTWRPAFG